MKVLLLYLMSFILLDAIVPRSCRTVKEPYYPEGYDNYDVIDEKVAGMELYFSDMENYKPTWCITMTQDSVVLNVGEEDSTLCHVAIPFTPERFVAFRDSLLKCNLTHICCEQLLPYQGLIETSLTLRNADDSIYFEGFHHEAYSEYYYNYDGDIPGLRKQFTSLFPDMFDGDIYIIKE